MKRTPRESSIALVDAFSQGNYRGNPAAVCVLDAMASERWMQAIAQEMNQAETAFVLPVDEYFELRWFTPVAEVDLCGHATLAAAHYLWESGVLAQDEQARFLTKSGMLTARRMPDGWIELDFPAEPVASVAPPEHVSEALGITPVFVGKNRFDYLFEVPSEEDVRLL